MGQRILTLEGQLAEQVGRTRGRKTGDPADAARTAAAADAAHAASDDRLRGRALLTKCRQIGAEHPDRALSLGEAGALNQHANLGHSVIEIFKSGGGRERLAFRVAELVGEKMPSKDELTTVH
jgi:hypothetical protein